MTLPIYIQKGKWIFFQWKDRTYLKDYNSSRGILFKFMHYNAEISYSVNKRHDEKITFIHAYSILIHTPLGPNSIHLQNYLKLFDYLFESPQIICYLKFFQTII